MGYFLCTTVEVRKRVITNQNRTLTVCMTDFVMFVLDTSNITTTEVVHPTKGASLVSFGLPAQ